MGKKFEQKESYTHKFAKELLANWLISYSFGSKLKIIDENEKEHELWGDWYIQTEYPITKTFPYYLCELVCPDPELPETCRYRGNYIPSNCLQCKQFMKKEKLLAVADIVSLHEGIIGDVFEIEHKNSLSSEKMDIYEEHKPAGNLWEIQAQHILGQIKRPDILHANLIL